MKVYWCTAERAKRTRSRVRRTLAHESCEVRVRWGSSEFVALFTPRTGIRPATLRRQIGMPAEELTTYPMLLGGRMKKVQPVGGQPSGPEHLAAMESTVFSKLSQVIAHCGVVRYEDGSPRQPGWVTVRTLGGNWQVTAKDPDSCCQLVSVASTLDDALAQLDLLLGTPDAPWELDRWAATQATQKGKRKGS